MLKIIVAEKMSDNPDQLVLALSQVASLRPESLTREIK